MTTLNFFCKGAEGSERIAIPVELPDEGGFSYDFGKKLKFCAANALTPSNVKTLVEFVDHIRFADDDSEDVFREEDGPIDEVINVKVDPDDVSFLLSCAAEMVEGFYDELIDGEIKDSLRFAK